MTTLELAQLSADEKTKRIGRLHGWTLWQRLSRIADPLHNMQVVCGHCNSVITKTNNYKWDEHERGPMGTLCSGGDWTLYCDYWIKGQDSITKLPPYLEDMHALRAVEKDLLFKEVHLYLEFCRLLSSRMGGAFDALFAEAKDRADVLLLVLA